MKNRTRSAGQDSNEDAPRLIEFAFPLKQASLDSVHEKNVRHGHISTLHIWPARRPLAACRAALIATLLPDPGDAEKRKELVEKIGGRVFEGIEKKKMPNGKVKEVVKEETIGGILHWGRETENKDTLDWFRQEIRKAYNGRAPKVLDPFAGGGAIPLEAMRLGCEATAIDINPVAWFILKCTLEYPQKLADTKRPLPEFVLKDKSFMSEFFKTQGLKGATLRTQLERLGFTDDDSGEQEQYLPTEGMAPDDPLLEANLAWHMRAWGKWVLDETRKELAEYYPTYADFEPLTVSKKKWTPREQKLVPLEENGTPNVEKLNTEFDKEYLKDKTNPRYIAKPTIAYLWARTVKCKNCRATIPLLKTRWLSKKEGKRVLLKMEPNAKRSGVVFDIESDVPAKGGNAAQKREHDKRIGAGTMSRAGTTCPCCGLIMTMEDIRLEGRAGRLSTVMTCVVVDGPQCREYHLPNELETKVVEKASSETKRLFESLPYGLPTEPLPSKEALGFRVPLYGIDQWHKLFLERQLLALGVLIRNLHRVPSSMKASGENDSWMEGIYSYVACSISRLLDFANCGVQWKLDATTINHSFVRFALPIVWDFAEGNVIGDSAGSFLLCYERIFTALETFNLSKFQPEAPHCLRQSSIKIEAGGFDAVVTDPPYYDAIPYSDLMDFFYVWLRRMLTPLGGEFAEQFREPLAPKWDEKEDDGELIDDSSRFGGDANKSRAAYENGMFRVFQKCRNILSPKGKLVIVFANKQPDAWEALVSAIIRAGFVVKGSWPIQTEQPSRMRAISSAALASSVWLVCEQRPQTAIPGWDEKVLEEMRHNIGKRLREFWDAGIRGPDFVWAGTGPALEAYSKYPVVKKARQPNELMPVSEFLRHVRRIVVDFVVGRVLTRDGETEGVSGLDDVTTYYLLHRHDFGMNDAPSGPCILYAISCGLTDGALADQYDILTRTGGIESDEEEEEEVSEEAESGGTGSTLKLKPWLQRNRPNMGYDPAVDSARARAEAQSPYLLPELKPEQAIRREIPLIDQIHRLMHLWKSGELPKVDDYLDTRALLRNKTFHQVLQALIELASAGSDERSILESISNHLRSRGVPIERQITMKPMEPEGD